MHAAMIVVRIMAVNRSLSSQWGKSLKPPFVAEHYCHLSIARQRSDRQPVPAGRHVLLCEEQSWMRCLPKE